MMTDPSGFAIITVMQWRTYVRKTLVAMGAVALFTVFVAYFELSRFTFGVECPLDLFAYRSLSEKIELKYLITKILYLDGARELKQLFAFNCGGGAQYFPMTLAYLQKTN